MHWFGILNAFTREGNKLSCPNSPNGSQWQCQWQNSGPLASCGDLIIRPAWRVGWLYVIGQLGRARGYTQPLWGAGPFRIASCCHWLLLFFAMGRGIRKKFIFSEGRRRSSNSAQFKFGAVHDQGFMCGHGAGGRRQRRRPAQAHFMDSPHQIS